MNTNKIETIKLEKRGITLKCNGLPRQRVQKGDARCVEHEPFGCSTIEGIAHNGAIEPLLVCRMDTQLMGATGQRLKADDSTLPPAALDRSDDLVACHSRLACGIIDLLARTVFVVSRKRKFYYTLISLGNAIKYCHVLLFHLAPCKLALEFLVHLH